MVKSLTGSRDESREHGRGNRPVADVLAREA